MASINNSSLSSSILQLGQAGHITQCFLARGILSAGCLDLKCIISNPCWYRTITYKLVNPRMFLFCMVKTTTVVF